jgi:hypothetical protein
MKEWIVEILGDVNSRMRDKIGVRRSCRTAWVGGQVAASQPLIMLR